MNRRRTASAAAIIVLAALALPRIVTADERNKETLLTFARDVSVPGKVLPAGTYVFRLADSDSTRHIVHVFDRHRRLLATCFTVAVERAAPSNGTSIVFVRHPGTAPAEIRQWYYPGQRSGEEFVYSTGLAR